MGNQFTSIYTEVLLKTPNNLTSELAVRHTQSNSEIKYSYYVR